MLVLISFYVLFGGVVISLESDLYADTTAVSPDTTVVLQGCGWRVAFGEQPMFDSTTTYEGWIDGAYAAFSIKNERNSVDDAMRWLDRYAMTSDGSQAEIIVDEVARFRFAFRLVDPGSAPIVTKIRFDVVNARTCVVMTTSIDGVPEHADTAWFFDSVDLDSP